VYAGGTPLSTFASGATIDNPGMVAPATTTALVCISQGQSDAFAHCASSSRLVITQGGFAGCTCHRCICRSLCRCGWQVACLTPGDALTGDSRLKERSTPVEVTLQVKAQETLHIRGHCLVALPAAQGQHCRTAAEGLRIAGCCAERTCGYYLEALSPQSWCCIRQLLQTRSWYLEYRLCIVY